VAEAEAAEAAEAREQKRDGEQDHFWPLGLITAGVTVALLVPVLRLWRASLGVPFLYTSDANSHAMMVKSVLDHGWYERNPNLGAPFVQHFADYPMADNLHLVVVRLLGLFGASWPVAVNLSYLLGFVVIAVVTAWVARRLGLSRLVSLAVGVLYAFLPFHFIRGELHLFLSQYFTVPLACYLVLRALGIGPPLRFSIGVVVMGVLIGSGGAYYAVFALLLFAVALAMNALARAGRPVLVQTAAVAAVIGVTLLANMAPDILYDREHGANPELAQRIPAEAEFYGLKLSALLLPREDHRIDRLGRVNEHYQDVSPVPGEQEYQALGLIGAAGLVWLLGAAVLRRRDEDELTSRLSGLTVATLLVATVGGLSAIVALKVTPQIRAWNRISVFVGFFALVAVGVLLDRAARRIPVGVLVAAAVLFGVLDQTSGADVPRYAAIDKQFTSDARFVEAIERHVGERALVFQLPYMPFPEHPPLVDIDGYDHLRGYLHSSTLRWSHGGMKGREEGDWQMAVVDKPVPDLVADVRGRGFDAVYIDRFGYLDRAAALERELTALLGPPAVVSEDNRLVLYRL